MNKGALKEYKARYQSFLKEGNQEDAAITLIEYILAVKQEEDSTVRWETLFWYYQYYPIMAIYRRMIRSINGLNPGMSGLSGLFEISKTEIATHLSPTYCPKTVTIESRQAPSTLIEVVEQSGLDVESGVICKPDMGERSFGVKIVRSREELVEYARGIKRRFLVQELIKEPKEFTLSFFRLAPDCPERTPASSTTEPPEAAIFEVRTLAERVLPTVVGNGTSTVAELIGLGDFSERQQKNMISMLSSQELEKVPLPGEVEEIGRIGSVDYGIELKIRELSPQQRSQLNKMVARILTNQQGELYDVWFGRFDLRANSFEELLEGRSKVIELNGAMAGPQEGLVKGLDIRERYRVFKAQYIRMGELALCNIAAGRGRKNSRILFFWETYKKLRSNPAQWKGALEARRTIRRAKRSLRGLF